MVAFAPFAARFPFETWILPRRHAPAFEHGSAAELRDLASVLRGVLRKLERALGDPPVELPAPQRAVRREREPRTTTGTSRSPRRLPALADSDRGSGFHVNPMPPEDAARFLRDTGD